MKADFKSIAISFLVSATLTILFGILPEILSYYALCIVIGGSSSYIVEFIFRHFGGNED